MTVQLTQKQREINPPLAFLIEHLDLPEATGIHDATWETFQFQFVNATQLLDITRKARQIGWSWVAAADAVANSILYKNTPHVFVSISQEEAKEKIRYARQIMASLDASVRPKNFPIENQTELEIPNGSRMISNPCKPPRGKGRVRIYLDEFAHYPIADEIFTAALPVTTRGGSLRIGSTPLGARGKFWEIYSQRIRPYPGFVRRYLPWWVARGLCKDVEMARQIAPSMPTAERVHAFGTSRVIEIFENMPLEDFEQEYECLWSDESASWITWDEIQKNQILDQQEGLQYRMVSISPDNNFDLQELDLALDYLHKLQVDGHIEMSLSGGIDVGRRRNASELILIGSGTGFDYFPYRLGITLDRCDFSLQEEIIKRTLRALDVTGMNIDQNGLGMQLAENMEKEFPEIVSAAVFTNASKKIWAVESKLQFQRGNCPIPLNKELSYQIHSVRKKQTMSNATIFDSDDPKHHADKFWAHSLAIDAAINMEGYSTGWGEMPI